MWPAVELAKAGAQLFSAPGSWLAQLPGRQPASPPATSCSTGWARTTRSRSSDIHAGRRRRRAPGAGGRADGAARSRSAGCCASSATATTPTSPRALKRRARRAGGRAAVGPPRHAAARHRAHAADATTTSTSPTGSTRAWCRSAKGAFTLDDYVGYVREFIRHIGAERLHVIAVCQPAVPVLAAVSLMAAAGEREPRSLMMMGGPIDARRSPTPVNDFATSKPLRWFETQPDPRGAGQLPRPRPPRLSGLPAARRLHGDEPASATSARTGTSTSTWSQGDLDGAEEHRRFYDEYNAVLDMPAEYYLDSIRIVFQQHLLPRGLWHVGGERGRARGDHAHRAADDRGRARRHLGPRPDAARRTTLCTGIPAERKRHLTVEGAGHYGIFSGRRWRETSIRGCATSSRRPTRRRPAAAIRRTDRLDRAAPDFDSRYAATKFTCGGFMLAEVLERSRDQVVDELERRAAVTESTELLISRPPQAPRRFRRGGDRRPLPRGGRRSDAGAEPLAPFDESARSNCANASWCGATSSNRSSSRRSQASPSETAIVAEWVGHADRKRLREQNQRLCALLDAVEDSAALFGPDGRILYCNRRAFQGLRDTIGAPAPRDHRPNASRARRPRRAGDRPSHRRAGAAGARARVVRDDAWGRAKEGQFDAVYRPDGSVGADRARRPRRPQPQAGRRRGWTC